MRVLVKRCQECWRQVQPQWWDGECIAATSLLGGGLFVLWLLTA